MERERKGEINDDFRISTLSNCVDCHAIYWDRKTRKEIEVGRVIKNYFHSV